MTIFDTLLLFIGAILLILSISSGIGLYSKAISTVESSEANKSIGTLWLLFLIGLFGGLLFVWLGLNDISQVSWIIWTLLIFMGIVSIMFIIA